MKSKQPLARQVDWAYYISTESSFENFFFKMINKQFLVSLQIFRLSILFCTKSKGGLNFSYFLGIFTPFPFHSVASVTLINTMVSFYINTISYALLWRLDIQGGLYTQIRGCFSIFLQNPISFNIDDTPSVWTPLTHVYIYTSAIPWANHQT